MPVLNVTLYYDIHHVLLPVHATVDTQHWLSAAHVYAVPHHTLFVIIQNLYLQTGV